MDYTTYVCPVFPLRRWARCRSGSKPVAKARVLSTSSVQHIPYKYGRIRCCSISERSQTQGFSQRHDPRARHLHAYTIPSVTISSSSPPFLAPLAVHAPPPIHCYCSRCLPPVTHATVMPVIDLPDRDHQTRFYPHMVAE